MAGTTKRHSRRPRPGRSCVGTAWTANTALSQEQTEGSVSKHATRIVRNRHHVLMRPRSAALGHSRGVTGDSGTAFRAFRKPPRGSPDAPSHRNIPHRLLRTLAFDTPLSQSFILASDSHSCRCLAPSARLNPPLLMPRLPPCSRDHCPCTTCTCQPCTRDCILTL